MPQASSNPAAAGASAASGAAKGSQPLAPDVIAAQVNPDSLPVYAGPTGSVTGVVRITGAPPPLRTITGAPPECAAEAQTFYGPLFRKGPGGELADAVVTVTGYSGFVPAAAPLVPVLSKGCVFSSRALALTLGQGISVSNENAFMVFPELQGAPKSALLAAMPKGGPVDLYPPKLGLYALIDAGHPFMSAEVYTFLFPTKTVTDVAGRYRIDGIPAGKARLDALWSMEEPSTGQDIEVREGQVLQVDLTLTYTGQAAKEVEKAPAPPAPPETAPQTPRGKR